MKNYNPYTPKYLKSLWGESYNYPMERFESNNLKEKYDILIKYNLLDYFDSMIYQNQLILDTFIEHMKNLTAIYLEVEYFNGTSINLWDLLNGDLSELIPLICDRMYLLKEVRTLVVISDWVDRICPNRIVGHYIKEYYYKNYAI